GYPHLSAQEVAHNGVWPLLVGVAKKWPIQHPFLPLRHWCVALGLSDSRVQAPCDKHLCKA
ncbi:hypothetical protein K5E40_30910, partial [Pseudomonas baetica]|uniref:hypothetical protein n=1 Tax=Pseudomonas baetica TaxID=674054 RepID=UPI001C8B3103